jgi:hypothetical protein
VNLDTCTTLSLEALRGQGVKTFTRGSDGTYSVEFFPLTGPEAPKDTSTQADPDMCRCGHSVHEHVQGLCGVGCDVEACAPPEAT